MNEIVIIDDTEPPAIDNKINEECKKKVLPLVICWIVGIILVVIIMAIIDSIYTK